ERSLDRRGDFVHAADLGGHVETKGSGECYEVDAIRFARSPVRKLGDDVSAYQRVLTVADRDVAGVVQDQENDRNVMGDAGREFLDAHHEIPVADDAHDGRVRLGQLGS